MLDGPWGIWATGWHWHPGELIGVALLVQGYLLGIGPLRLRYQWADRVEPRHVLLFLLGAFALLLAIASPLHELSEDLFSAHMTQHMVLTLVVAPLLLLGTPEWLLSPLLRYALLVAPLRWMRASTPMLRFVVRQVPLLRLTRLLTHPVVAFFLFTAVFSLWHVPPWYQAAVHNDLVHTLEHATLLATAVLVWWPILSPLSEAPRLSYPGQMLYLLLLSVATTPLFAILVFSQQALYPWYAVTAPLWGISPVTDQQIGGIIMKVPFSLVFLTLLAIVFFRWFAQEEREAQGEATGPTISLPTWGDERQ